MRITDHTWKDSQKIKIKKKTKIPRVTIMKNWNFQKYVADCPLEQKKHEKTPVSSSNLKLSPGLVP